MARPVLIVAHGQPGDPAPQQAAIEAMAARVGALLPAQEVCGATLAAEGALARGIRDEALVYPLFMAGGWFTRVELPRRLGLLGARGLAVLPPFGADPGLPELARKQLAACAGSEGWSLSEVAVLIAAHGSGRSRAPSQAACDLAQKLAPHVGSIRCGFIEEAPLLADQARGLGSRAICLPFFATEAGHVTEDLPQAMEAAGFTGRVLPPLGLAPEVPQMIAAAVGRGG